MSNMKIQLSPDIAVEFEQLMRLSHLLQLNRVPKDYSPLPTFSAVRQKCETSVSRSQMEVITPPPGGLSSDIVVTCVRRETYVVYSTWETSYLSLHPQAAKDHCVWAVSPTLLSPPLPPFALFPPSSLANPPHAHTPVRMRSSDRHLSVEHIENIRLWKTRKFVEREVKSKERWRGGVADWTHRIANPK
jgi:hypothetical protein